MQKRYLPILAHVTAWGFILALPIFFSLRMDYEITWLRYFGHVLDIALFMIVFYVSYSLLIPRWLFRKKVWQFIAISLGFLIVCGFASTLMHVWWFRLEEAYGLHQQKNILPPPRDFMAMRNLLMLVLTAGLSVAIRVSMRWFKLDREKQELEKAHSEAELKNLKSQLNPHFLFNTLNNIYSLIALNQDKAQLAVHNLSCLLRHVLYDDKGQLVSLDKEIDFMHSYIELMSLRLTGKVKLEVSLPERGSGLMVAPLLFITLIENAFKHGISQSEASFIFISLRVTDRKAIECVILNSYFPKAENDHSGSGIGLENLRRRLELIYPGRSELITERRDDRYFASLIISPEEEKNKTEISL